MSIETEKSTLTDTEPEDDTEATFIKYKENGFESKKIHQWAVGGLVLIVFVSAAFFAYRYWYSNQTHEQQIVNERQEEKEAEEVLYVEGWKTYRHDVLGIQFQYPEAWGEPYTEPTSNITNLSIVNDRFKGSRGNAYAHAIFIQFPDDNAPILEFFDDVFEGNYYPNSQTWELGYIDNIPLLKETKNICDYKIHFDYRPQWDDTLTETYSTCSDSIKEYLTRNTRTISQTTHSYSLNNIGFKKLKNGYFDNILIKDYIDGLWQTEEASLTFDQFIEKAEIDLASYKNNKQNLVTFIKTIQSFSPPALETPSQDTILNENSDIKTIRTYYTHITNGELQKAYDMYGIKRPNFETFTEWYKNTYFANPYGFEEVAPHRYQFNVDFQDHNQSAEQYRVVMEIEKDTITTLSSEKLIGKESEYKNLKAYVKQRLGRNYVILYENGHEIVIDEASDEPFGENAYKFYNPAFSPNGRYITYTAVGWEWYIVRIYDTVSKKKILDLPSGYLYQFTPDETQLATCANNHFIGDQYASVYSLPDTSVTFDLFKHVNQYEYFDVECEYNESEQSVTYVLSGIFDEEKGLMNYDDKKIFNYSLTKKEITEVE